VQVERMKQMGIGQAQRPWRVGELRVAPRATLPTVRSRCRRRCSDRTRRKTEWERRAGCFSPKVV
jgi:hypothetical protein